MFVAWNRLNRIFSGPFSFPAFSRIELNSRNYTWLEA